MGAYYQNFVVFDTSETGSIDFSQVGETSINTLRLNNSGSQTFVKYNGLMPSSVSSLSTKEGPYTYEEILNILTGSAWEIPPTEQ
tara:strand:+ start:247 stop:501 length:255 start_codon:yes stop_codon:yes gene_type:complete